MPAMRSSAMMPIPPGNRSKRRAGHGLTISRTRKGDKPNQDAPTRWRPVPNKRNELSRHLVDDDLARIFPAEMALGAPPWPRCPRWR